MNATVGWFGWAMTAICAANALLLWRHARFMHKMFRESQEGWRRALGTAKAANLRSLENLQLAVALTRHVPAPLAQAVWTQYSVHQAPEHDA